MARNTNGGAKCSFLRQNAPRRRWNHPQGENLEVIIISIQNRRTKEINHLTFREWPKLLSARTCKVGMTLWGGRVVMAPSELTPRQPVAPIDYTKDLPCPILGLFGEEDQSPTPAHVAQLEEALKQHGKTYEFHMYPKAGHGFFYYHRPAYRAEQAVDGWEKIFAFLETYL